MVASTRLKNKLAHPAAPVMTAAAKEKAGIKIRRRPKKVTKDETIRELQARINALENPSEETYSKEPLFVKGSSPRLDEDTSYAEPEIPTEVDSDDQVILGRKRSATSALPEDPRSLKRTKAYKNLEEIRPTLRNKSSGMKPDWRKSVKQSTPRRMASGTCSRGQPGSSSSVLSSSTAIHQSPPPDLELDHTSSMLAFSSPPIFSKLHSPPPFHGNIVPLVDAKATVDRGHGEHSLVPFTLPRREGQRQPGLKDLPQWLREGFRNRFICRIIEQVLSSETPWSHPGLLPLQRELNRIFPTHRIRLHGDDAIVVPTLRELGVLRCHIGNEGLDAVIEYLPGQVDKKGLKSKAARAKYVATVLTDPQHPSVWEYFRPGTIPLAGERAYYDEKRRGPFQSEPVLRALSVYYTKSGIREPVPSTDPGEGLRPIGALALAATAVERGYRRHLTGDYVEDGSEFSSSKWLSTTNTYLDKIQNDLSGDHWTAIFQALQRLQESRARAGMIELGAPLTPKLRDAFLPDDPPTSPSMD